MRIAMVTGGTGFIGSSVANKLVRSGFNTHVLVRDRQNLKKLDELHGLLKIHRYDGTYKSLSVAMRDVRPDVVFHIAARTQANHQPADIEALVHGNILFGTQLIEAMLEGECTRLINTSSFWQHFEGKEYSPVCLYAATKQAFECLLQFYLETTPLKAISLVLHDTYGPNDGRGKIVDLLGLAAKRQLEISLTPGEQLLDLVYVDDVVDAYLSAEKMLLNMPPSTHQRYAVSSGTCITIRQLVMQYQEAIGLEIPVKWGGRPYRAREIMTPINGLQILPDWERKIDLISGLVRTYASL